MNSITNNPYRIVGILANASSREVLSRRSRISAYVKVSKEISSEYDFSFLNSIQRTNSIIDKAFSDIEQNQNKVVHSLFWFTNLNTVDNTAIQHLVSGNKEKAIEIWYKLTEEKEVTSKNFSAFNNIGTLYLLENSKDEIKQGITAKIKLIVSENFKDFVHTVADETFSIDKNRQIEILIDELLSQFKNKYSTAETIELFSNCNGTAQKYLSKKFTEEPIHKIETQIEQCTKKRAKDKSNAYKYGTDLYSNTKSELTLLKSIVGNTNLQYKMLADNIAKELQQCSIDYFNESQKLERNNNYLEEAMKLAKLAESVAVNDTTKSKAKENISSLEGMKDRELNQAIDILKSIKQAFQTNEAKITKEVLEMPMGYNQSINWTKVNQMIANSLDWDKVIELIKETISLRSIEKIKKSDKLTKITEYKSLVDFILGKLNYSQKNQIKYICYWKTVSTTQTTTSRPTTSTTSNSNNNEGIPTWLYWVGGIILLIILSKACN
ncbi:hypothetical protein SAMN05421738_106113 [Algoriella xinjiangensis]|uniref:Uncharacterized protein n=1 Tax=Algoriella xinjiangensis TaxID=684065 RepID=A0A1I4W320_9FLAO|nr:hypothetical protein [Algoriella xinjiangensis]SFN07855.1 hypothetical protein SAMN05421738_106113 [Algoriella xinjiangensis]